MKNLDNDWRYVSGYEGVYAVSERGEVWSCRRRKLLKQVANPNYPRVSLSHKNKRVNRTVHILVAEAFIGKRPQGKEVNHKDGNKCNNHIDNLEYCTKSENNKHAHSTGLNRQQGKRNNYSIFYSKLSEAEKIERRKKKSKEMRAAYDRIKANSMLIGKDGK